MIVSLFLSLLWIGALLHFDNSSHTLFYEVNIEANSKQRHIYKLNTITKEKNCLTCNVSIDSCHYFESIFSTDAKYFILQCLGPRIPFVLLKETSNLDQGIQKADGFTISLINGRSWAIFYQILSQYLAKTISYHWW